MAFALLATFPVLAAARVSPTIAGPARPSPCGLPATAASKQALARRRVAPVSRRILAARKRVAVASSLGPQYDAFVDKIVNPGPLFESVEQANTVLEAVLGTVGVSFLATFVVAPRFADTLKEGEGWKDIYASLLSTGVKDISAEEANKKAGSGQGILLDVRMEEKFAQKSLPNAINIPLYRPIQLTNPVAILRALAFAFFGVSNSERTPGWLETVQETIPTNKPVYIMCNTGGSLENKPGTKFGFESQSLKALHFLRQAGYRNVVHVKEGMRMIKS